MNGRLKIKWWYHWSSYEAFERSREKWLQVQQPFRLAVVRAGGPVSAYVPIRPPTQIDFFKSKKQGSRVAAAPQAAVGVVRQRPLAAVPRP